MAKVAKRRGRYIIDFYDTYGKRRWITMPKGTTKKKATEKLREIEDQLRRGIYLPDKKIPNFKKIAKDWIEFKKPNLRYSTWSVYEGHTRNHFKDFDPIKINRITTAKVEKWISARHKESMNLLTIKKILVTLGQIMAYAVRHGYIGYNPVRDAERPRGNGKSEESKIRVLTPAEIKSFLEVEKDMKYRTLFTLAVFSGARQGELLGLKWSDIKWGNNQIHIQRTFNKNNWYDVKTAASNRKIDIGPSMIAKLKEWKLACPSNAYDLVFPNKAGKPIDHNNLRKWHFYPALETAGLPQIRFHDLRHTYASLLIEQGENIKYIQSQLGHSSPTVTLNVYSHLMKSVNREAALRLENAIFEINGSKMVANNQKGETANTVFT
jgi:integrase